MARLGLRFDFRNPAFAGTSMAERYAAALDMVEWGDRLGFVSVLVSEHHGSDDGYLPSPITMLAAMAARTRRLRVQISALIAPLHNPLRIAEDLVVLDLISGGRLDLVVANGYVGAEFAMFGRALSERAARTTELVHTLRAAWRGEPFEFRGRTVRVTPSPCQPGGPKIILGGSSERAARRAARIADGFAPSVASLWDHYRDELRILGKPDPGPHRGGGTGFVHVTDDPDKGWAQIAAYAMHEVNTYGAWNLAAGTSKLTSYTPVADAETLRTTGQYRALRPAELVEEINAKGAAGFTLLHPLMGGIPPALAWQSLQRFEAEVLPHLM
jgi:alkanesulfonate monooxygenase SsuD/methylene tetrahydromethanopterin reductase-like flavin-dependent oxidoreductase (luciferase family)